MKWRYINCHDTSLANIGYYYGKSDNLVIDEIFDQYDKPLLKIAGFDLDQTLIKPKSGRRFSRNHEDWCWLYDNNIIKNKLMYYQNKQYILLIITNQAGIKTSDDKLAMFKSKIELMEEDIRKTHPDLMFQIFCLNNKDIHRKPYPTVLEKYDLDYDKTFYCGDAAGRENDHASSDIKFAYNLGIKFMTPEKMFLKSNNYGVLEYPDLMINNNTIDYSKINCKIKNFIIMVGFPGSGKSYIASQIKSYFTNNDSSLTIISQDKIGSKSKMNKLINGKIKNKENIIIDNTNLDCNVRKTYITLAKKNKYMVTIIHVNTDIRICKHNNYYRYLKHYNNNAKLVPEIAYRIMNKKYVDPKNDKNVDTILSATSGVPYDPIYHYNFY